MKILFYLLILVLTTINAFAQGYSGLIARWPFNGNANDVSGNGINGIVHGATPSAGYNGLPNTAYTFNGSSDYITVPYNSMMNAKLHSICVLIKPLGFYSGLCQGNYILCRGWENRSDFYGLEFFDNAYDNDCNTYSPANEVFAGGTGAAIVSDPGSAWYYTAPIVAGNWYCMTLTYDGSFTRIYVNGTLKTTFHNTSTYAASTDSINICRSEFGPLWEYWVNGVIDEIRLYDRALSATEVNMFCDSAESIVPNVNDCDSVSLPDTLKICQNSSITLPAILYGANPSPEIRWRPSTGLSDTGVLNPSLTVATASGWYYINIGPAPCSYNDSIYIDVSTVDTIYSHNMISVCASQSPVVLNGPVGYNSYLWNTGSNSSAVSGASAGTYWVDAFNGSCGMFSDTFYVAFKPMPLILWPGDTTICQGAIINLNSPQPPGALYSWSNGSNASSIDISGSGNYSLTVTASGCSTSASEQIYELPPPSFELGPDTTLCAGDMLSLQVNADNAAYLWRDGSSNNNFQITGAGTYWVAVSNSCGTASDTIHVSYDFCDIWFPSAFTPNDDGRNDIIRVVGSLSEYKDFSLAIYNRFGQRVFYTRDIYSGWDGTFKGEKQDIGTYFYVIFYSINGKKGMMKGDVELIR